MRSHFLLNLRRRPGLPGTAAGMWLLILALFLVTCTEKSTPAEPEPTPTPSPAEQAPAAVTPGPASAPDITSIIAALEKTPPRGASVSPPESRIAALMELYQRACERGLLMEETCCQGAIPTCDIILNGDRATTYSLPAGSMDANLPQGAFFQLVSRAESVDDPLDPEAQWGGSAVAIGGLLIYQVYTEGFWEVAPGDYVVLLRRDAEGDRVTLLDENMEERDFGTWQLLRLDPEPEPQPAEPFSYVTSEQICFAQKIYQACLNLIPPAAGTGPNVDLLKIAVEELMADKLLPEDAQVYVEGALADVAGAPAVEVCSKALAEPTECLPSAVMAAAEVPGDTSNLEGLGLLTSTISASIGISETIPGAGVLAVTQEIPDQVVDGSGNAVPLPEGYYRVDLLRVPDGTGRWLSQFASRDAVFYGLAAPVRVAGEPLTGEDQVGGNDVVLKSVVIRVCRTYGTELACSTLFCRSGCHKYPLTLIY